jgi:hypothetical protein
MVDLGLVGRRLVDIADRLGGSRHVCRGQLTLMFSSKFIEKYCLSLFNEDDDTSQQWS